MYALLLDGLSTLTLNPVSHHHSIIILCLLTVAVSA